MSDLPEQDSSPESAHSSPRRDAILSEAARLFNENGFHDTRLSDVADRLGVVKTTISYHFRSKEALLQQLYGQACDMVEADLAAARAEPSGLAGIRLWLRRNFERETQVLSGNTPPLAIVGDLNAMPDDDKPGVRARIWKQASAMRELLIRGQADGSVAMVSVEATTFLLLGLRHWIRDWMVALPGTDTASRLRALETLILCGICADGAWTPPSYARPKRDDAPFAVFDREARSQLKREAFLRAGTRFLNQNGYRNLSLQDVAADLGVSRSAFYYYIADKEALLCKSVERTLEQLEKAIYASDQAAPDAASRLWCVLRDVFEGHASDLDPLVRLNLLNSLPNAQRAVAMARFRKIMAGIGQIVADGLVDGSVRPVNVSGAEQILMGALFAANWPKMSFNPSDPAEAASPRPIPVLSMDYFEPLFGGIATNRARAEAGWPA